MPERKPSSMTVPDWVEHQIRAAEAAGAFANLPGTGKPLAGLERPRTELDWVAEYLRREDVDTAALLPPALAIAKEVELLPLRLLRETSETRVRALVSELNARISAAHAAPQVGPPFRVKLVKADEVVADWRSARALLAERAATAREAAAREASTTVQPVRRPRRRWFGRR